MVAEPSFLRVHPLPVSRSRLSRLLPTSSSFPGSVEVSLCRSSLGAPVLPVIYILTRHPRLDPHPGPHSGRPALPCPGLNQHPPDALPRLLPVLLLYSPEPRSLCVHLCCGRAPVTSVHPVRTPRPAGAPGSPSWVSSHVSPEAAVLTCSWSPPAGCPRAPPNPTGLQVMASSHYLSGLGGCGWRGHLPAAPPLVPQCPPPLLSFLPCNDFCVSLFPDPGLPGQSRQWTPCPKSCLSLLVLISCRCLA